MKNKAVLSLLLLAALSPVTARAQGRAHDFGAGVYIGTPFGATVKYWLDSKTAVDAALGVQGDSFDAHADLLVHLRDLLPKPKEGRLLPYLGLGVKIKDEKETLFGIRFLGGVSYLFPKHPLEVFAEIAPVLRFTPSTGSNLDGGAGLRFYFGK